MERVVGIDTEISKTSSVASHQHPLLHWKIKQRTLWSLVAAWESWHCLQKMVFSEMDNVFAIANNDLTQNVVSLIFWCCKCQRYQHSCCSQEQYKSSCWIPLWSWVCCYHEQCHTNGTAHHDCFHIILVHNCTTPHVGFCFDHGSAATMNNVTASDVLFHNCTTHHDCFRVDFDFAANNCNVNWNANGEERNPEAHIWWCTAETCTAFGREIDDSSGSYRTKNGAECISITDWSKAIGTEGTKTNKPWWWP